MNFDERLDELFIDLPEAPEAVGNYLGTVRVGKLIFASGALPLAEGRMQFPGRVGVDVRLDNARGAARVAAIQLLSLVAAELGGTLNKVRRVVKVEGFVASGADFKDHSKVVDGASELFVQIFGPFGKHARTAIGVASLPKGACVELSAIFETK